MPDTAQKIVIALQDSHVFDLIKEIIPQEYSLIVCNNNNELFPQLIQYPDSYSAIIISSTSDNLNLLRKINTCSKTKVIPIIMQANDNLSEDDINSYIRAGAHYYLPEPLEANNIKDILFAAIRDRKRHLAARNDISAEQSSLVMQNAEFKFQRLEECQSLASFFANACPNPRLAVIGIAEILINAVEHGNLGISYTEKTKLQSADNWVTEVERRVNLPENKNKYASVSFKRTPEHIQLYVQDEGDGFDWNKFQSLDAARICENHGRGIIMAKNLAFDKLEYLDKGNIVNCFIKLGT